MKNINKSQFKEFLVDFKKAEKLKENIEVLTKDITHLELALGYSMYKESRDAFLEGITKAKIEKCEKELEYLKIKQKIIKFENQFN